MCMRTVIRYRLNTASAAPPRWIGHREIRFIRRKSFSPVTNIPPASIPLRPRSLLPSRLLRNCWFTRLTIIWHLAYLVVFSLYPSRSIRIADRLAFIPPSCLGQVREKPDFHPESRFGGLICVRVYANHSFPSCRVQEKCESRYHAGDDEDGYVCPPSPTISHWVSNPLMGC